MGQEYWSSSSHPSTVSPLLQKIQIFRHYIYQRSILYLRIRLVFRIVENSTYKYNTKGINLETRERVRIIWWQISHCQVGRCLYLQLEPSSIIFESWTSFMTNIARDNYVALKSPMSGTHPPLSRISHDSDEDSLRALEISEGPSASPVGFVRYVFSTKPKENRSYSSYW